MYITYYFQLWNEFGYVHLEWDVVFGHIRKNGQQIFGFLFILLKFIPFNLQYTCKLYKKLVCTSIIIVCIVLFIGTWKNQVEFNISRNCVTSVV